MVCLGGGEMVRGGRGWFVIKEMKSAQGTPLTLTEPASQLPGTLII